MFDQRKRPIRKTEKPWLELEVEDVPSNINRTKGRPAVGVLLTGSPSKAALEAGLKTGDIIVAINQRVVYNQKELFSYIDRELKPREVVTLRVIRDDEAMDIPMKLGSRTTDSEIHQQLQESIQETTLNCPYCGADVNNAAETCPQCKKELWFPNQKENATYPKKSKRKSISSYGLLSEKPIAYKIKRAVVALNGKIYTSSDITSSTISKIQEGDKVIILEESGEFYKVRLESDNEVTGYVEKDLFALKRAVVFFRGEIFVKPQDLSEAVCEVFRGDKLIIIDETEKLYHVKLETDRRISGYIKKELLGPLEVKDDKTITQPTAIIPKTNTYDYQNKGHLSQQSNTSSTNQKLKREYREAKDNLNKVTPRSLPLTLLIILSCLVLAWVIFLNNNDKYPTWNYDDFGKVAAIPLVIVIAGFIIALIIGAPLRQAKTRVREVEQEIRSKGLDPRQLLSESNRLGAQQQNKAGSYIKQSASTTSGWGTFGNVMWVIFGGGLSTCIEYALAGIASCITLIGIPFGIQYFKLAGLVISPFGKEVVTEKEGCLMTGMNILWIFTVGLPVTLTHLFWGIILTITIIGFPFAKQHFKLMVLSFTPFGKRVQ